MKVKSVKQDIKLTNALRKHRSKLEGAQTPRHYIPWPKAYLTVLALKAPTSRRNSVTIDEVRETLNNVGLEYNSPAASFLAKAVEQFIPTNAREYSNDLPDLTFAMTLDYDRRFNSDTGAWEWCFWFKNPKAALKLLVEVWPIVTTLIELIEENENR